MRILKVLLISLVVLVSLAVGFGCWAVVYGPEHVDWTARKGDVERVILEKTGYTVKFDGAIDLRLYPVPYVRAERMSVASFGGEKKDLFAAKNVYLELSLPRLLTLQLGVRQFSMEEPTVWMHRSAKGVASWMSAERQAELEAKAKEKKAKGEDVEEASDALDLGPLKAIGQVLLTNGKLLFEDDKNGVRYDLKDFNLEMGGDDLEHAALKMSAVLNTVPLKAEGALDLVHLAGKTPLKTVLAIGANTVSLDGTLSDALDEPSYEGTVSIKGSDFLEALYHIQDLPLEDMMPSKPMDISAKVSWKKGETDVQDLKAVFGKTDKMTLTGSVRQKAGHGRKGNAGLAVRLRSGDVVDLATFGLCEEEGRARSASAKGRKAASSGDDGAEAGGGHWSREALNTAFFANTDTDIDLALAGLTCGARTYQNLAVRMESKNGTVLLKDIHFGLLGGLISLNGKLKAEDAYLQGKLNTELTKLPVERLTAKAGETPSFKLPLSGQAEVTFEGKSQADMVASLAGTAAFHSNAFQFKGASFTNLMSSLDTLWGSKGTTDGGAKETATLDYSATLQNGVMKTDKLLIKSGSTEVTGEGSVNLAAWTIDHKVKAAASLDSVGVGASLPVTVKGSLSDPTIAPDMETPQGVGAAVGAAVGGPVGAGVGAVLGGIVDERLAKRKAKHAAAAAQGASGTEGTGSPSAGGAAGNPLSPENVGGALMDLFGKQ